jgi:hypothetical protein
LAPSKSLWSGRRCLNDAALAHCSSRATFYRKLKRLTVILPSLMAENLFQRPHWRISTISGSIRMSCASILPQAAFPMGSSQAFWAATS